MNLLYFYLKKHKSLLFFALIMAAINICFSLSDSIITGKLLQDCGVGLSKYKGNEMGYVKSVAFWLGLSFGATMIFRITKNFQDYFTNIAIQRTRAEMYTDGIKKSLDLPFEDFEDESRFGLFNRYGKTVTAISVKSICTFQQVFKSTWLSGAFSPITGDRFQLIQSH